MNSNILQPFLATAGVAILDGALATELEARGADINDALWSAGLLLENPDLPVSPGAAFLTTRRLN